MTDPLRGEIWLMEFDPTRGREQAGRRPALVVSRDPFNRSAAGLVVVVPLTSKEKGIPYHVVIDAPQGGLRTRSFAKCEDLRSVSKARFVERWGKVGSATLDEVGLRLRLLLDL